MADAYTDLAALTALDPHGRLWLNEKLQVWTYAGCPFEPKATNVQMPIKSVPDARVQAALQDGSYIGAVLDVNRSPVKALAVVKAPDDPTVILRPLTLADLGTAAAA